jgi:hypothetical protein
MQRIKHFARTIISWSIIIFTAAKTSLLKTNKGRWKKVSQEIPHWDDRNRAIAGFIPSGVSVLDLGSGAQTMRHHLKPGCQYQPCDIVQSSPDIIHCDFNSGIYPVITTKYDYVICSGVFEYMRDPARFIFEIRNYGRKIFFTFNPSNLKQMLVKRLGCGWVNHLTEPQLEQLFASAALSWRVIHRKNTSPEVEEIIYELIPE